MSPGPSTRVRRAFFAALQRAPLYSPERWYRLFPRRKDRRVGLQRSDGSAGILLLVPVAADNKIYLASEEGVVIVLNGGEELKVLARNKLDGQILATPAIVEGKIYVRTEDQLYAFGR
jgi:hypothetical protein